MSKRFYVCTIFENDYLKANKLRLYESYSSLACAKKVALKGIQQYNHKVIFIISVINEFYQIYVLTADGIFSKYKKIDMFNLEDSKLANAASDYAISNAAFLKSNLDYLKTGDHIMSACDFCRKDYRCFFLYLYLQNKLELSSVCSLF